MKKKGVAACYRFVLLCVLLVLRFFFVCVCVRVCVLLRSACARLICKVSKKIVIFSGFRFQGVILAK